MLAILLQKYEKNPFIIHFVTLEVLLIKFTQNLINMSRILYTQHVLRICVCTVFTKVSCTSVFCMHSTGRHSVIRTSRNTLVVREYARTRIEAYYAMFVSRYAARLNAYKKQRYKKLL